MNNISVLHFFYTKTITPFTQKYEKKLTTVVTLCFEYFKIKHQWIHLLICSEEEIQNLNQQFRSKNKPTDVLSWKYQKDETIPDKMPWGEIAICLSITQKQALKNGWSLEIEIIRLLVHGIVHLAGYDHETIEEEKEMLAIEHGLLQQLGYDFIYI